MPRLLWWAPLGLLLIAAALVGLRWGVAVASLTETDVINHYAAMYLEAGPEGAEASDCLARPGLRADVWLIVICGAGEGETQYHVDRFGRLVGRAPASGPEA